MLSRIEWRATIASLVIGLLVSAVTMGFIWPLMGDPYMVPLVIGAVAFTGFAIGGISYLVMSVKR